MRWAHWVLSIHHSDDGRWTKPWGAEFCGAYSAKPCALHLPYFAGPGSSQLSGGHKAPDTAWEELGQADEALTMGLCRQSHGAQTCCPVGAWALPAWLALSWCPAVSQ